MIKLNLTSVTSRDVWCQINVELFGILIKIKHMGHISHSILGPEFGFEVKNYNFIKM